MYSLSDARKYLRLAEKRHEAAQECGRFDMSAKQTLRMYHAAENLRNWKGIVARAERDEARATWRERACSH